MKTLLQLIFTGFLIQLYVPAEAQVFTENFDGGSVNMVSSGTPGFNVSNAFFQSAPNSSSGSFSISGSSTLSSPSFSTSGNNFVTLDFDHICKTSFFDSCVIELSVNGGASWNQVNPATSNYFGSSSLFVTMNRFNSYSYNLWDGNNAGTIANPWWQHESFDISNLCGNQASVIIRYRMRDNSNNGMEGYYGWLLDNIIVNASPCELQPPVIVPASPPLSGNIYSLGPFYMADSITDWTGVSAQLFYTVNNGTLQSVSMTPTIYPINVGYIPAVNSGDSVCCYVVATDPCGNISQYPATAACFIALPNATVPYCDDFDGGSPQWTSTISSGTSQWQLGTPSFGTTNSSHSGLNAWDVDLSSGYQNNSLCFVESPPFDFTSVPKAIISLWKNHNTPFGGDGCILQYRIGSLSNWDDVGTLSDPNGINWYNSFIGNSAGWSGQSGGWNVASYTLDSSSPLANQPSVYFRFLFTSGLTGTLDGFSIDDFCISLPPPNDFSLDTILSPAQSAAVGAIIPLIVTLHNYGSATQTSAAISCTVNGGIPINYNWTGSLDPGLVEDVTIASLTVTSGTSLICCTVALSGDSIANNNTVCKQSIGVPVLQLPYSDNFEGANIGWTSTTDPSAISLEIWELGFPNFGATTGTHSGFNAWDINLNATYSDNDFTYLTSPIFDLTGDTNATVSFWHNFNTEATYDGARVEYTTNGSNWNVLGFVADPLATNWYNFAQIFSSQLPGWQGNSTGWLQSTFNLSSFNNAPFLQFRFVFTSDGSISTDGYSIDDFSIRVPSPIDAGINGLYLTNALPAGSMAPAWQIGIQNFGSQTISSVPVTYTINGVVIASATYNGILFPNDLATVMVNGYTVPTGEYTLCAYTSLPLDGYLFNDSACATLSGIPIITPRYDDDFENGNIGWINYTLGDPSTKWELGTPAFGATTGAYSGTNCWDINLNTGYDPQTSCYLFTPFFDFSNTNNPYISFYLNYKTDPLYDGMHLEYTLDGATWNVLGNIGDPNSINWYTHILNSTSLPAWEGNSNGWRFSKYDLSILTGQTSVRFRFIFNSDFGIGYDGVSIDDITVFTSYSQDVSMGKVISPALNTSAPFFTPVSVRVYNNGYQSATGFIVSYSANGGAVTSSNVTATVFPNDSIDITLNGFTTQIGSNSIIAYTSLNSDLYRANDTITYNFNAVFTTTPPYVDHFDSTNVGWAVDSSVTGFTQWELGTPAFGSTNSVHTGTGCWDVNLNSPYDNSATTRLVSPVFNYVNSVSSVFKFWTNYSMEYAQDGMRVEYTTDNINWQPLGTFNDPLGTNWYTVNNVAAFSGPAFTGPSFGWVQSSYNTSAFSGLGFVRYSFVFKSDVNLSGDGVSVDDVELTSVVGVSENTSFAQIKIQPNPVHDFLNLSIVTDPQLSIHSNKNILLSICDALGKQVIQQNIIQSTFVQLNNIDVSALAEGVYTLHLKFNDGIAVQKFIKQ